MKKSTISGLTITAVWILGILFLVPVNDFFELDLNEKGDFLAGIVAPLAFFWFILAYFLQKEELNENTKALKGQEKQLEETKEQFKIQQFENSFFNLLRIQSDIRNELHVRSRILKKDGTRVNESTFKGKDFFNLILNHLTFINLSFEELMYYSSPVPGTAYVNNLYLINLDYGITRDQHHKNLELTKEEKAKESYLIIYNSYLNELGHYFRHLYNILIFIQDFSKNYKEERKVELMKKYSKLVQAQLSDSELSVLFYNGLLFPNMKVAIINHDLIENLNSNSLIEKDHIDFYPDIEIKKPPRSNN